MDRMQTCFSHAIFLFMRFDGSKFPFSLSLFFFFLRKEIVYSLSKQITFLKQLQYPIQYGFYRIESIHNREEKLGENIEMRFLGCFTKRKKNKIKRKYRIYNRGTGAFIGLITKWLRILSLGGNDTCNDSCYFPCI